ncbi:MAG: hypothetical protein ACT6R4_37630, partial [Variovorax sp.]
MSIAETIDGAGVAQLTALIRRGELGAVELAERRLADIEGRAARTNAFVTVDREGALAQAREAD